jgi:predicted ATPase
LVMTSARAQPVVIAVEDLQWADPTTLELLRGIAERGALAPLFVLIPSLGPPLRFDPPPGGLLLACMWTAPRFDRTGSVAR